MTQAKVDADTVLGTGRGTFLLSIKTGRSVGWLNRVLIDNEYRNRGIVDDRTL